MSDVKNVLKKFEDAGFYFEKRSEYHYQISTPQGLLNFWPTTSKWNVLSIKKSEVGVEKLMDFLQSMGKTGEELSLKITTPTDIFLQRLEEIPWNYQYDGSQYHYTTVNGKLDFCPETGFWQVKDIGLYSRGVETLIDYLKVNSDVHNPPERKIDYIDSVVFEQVKFNNLNGVFLKLYDVWWKNINGSYILVENKEELDVIYKNYTLGLF